jgi:hypothetical protein
LDDDVPYWIQEKWVFKKGVTGALLVPLTSRCDQAPGKNIQPQFGFIVVYLGLNLRPFVACRAALRRRNLSRRRPCKGGFAVCNYSFDRAINLVLLKNAK